MCSKKSLFSLLITCLWVSLAYPHFAFGEGTTHTKIDVASGISVTGKDGKVLVVVFKDGVPASGIEIKTPRGILRTDSEGVATGTLPQGSGQKLEVISTGQDFKINIVGNEETQVVINLLSDKSDVAVENAKGETVKNNSNAPKRPVNFKVTSKSGQAISEATLLFSGVDQVFKTDANGNITTEIPEGAYSASVFHPDFQTETLGDIKIGGSEKANFAVSLKTAQNQLEEVVVLAPKIKGSLSALVEVRKQSSAVTDVLGSEQMARAGDGDAASSLRRVTGLTLVGGKYVYVRGLGERYSGVQMNSFSLPSPEPTRRVVPLDLFPTSIMESIIVQKSYSPDLPGEFGGGIIQLKTRSLPEKFFVRAQLSTAFENAGNHLNHAGGSTDWLGIDDGTREMPTAIKNVIDQGKKFSVNTPGFSEGVSQQELDAMGRSLSNSYVLDRSEAASMPGISVAAGSGWKLPSVKLGTAGSFLYGQSTDSVERVSRSFIVNGPGFLGKESETRSESAEVETRLAGSFDVGAQIAKNHNLNVSTFLLRNTTKLSQFGTTIQGSNLPSDTLTMDFTERQLWTRTVRGDHDLKRVTGFPVLVDWRTGWADASRYSPDRRELVYNVDGANQNLLDGSSGNRRSYGDLTDKTEERAINFAIPISNSTREIARFKVGALQFEKKRNSEMTRLYFENQTGQPIADATTGFAQGNIKNGGVVLKNLSADPSQADNYTGDQTIDAQFAMVEVSPWEQISLQAGLRWETSDQLVSTFNYTTPSTPSSVSTINMRDTLPSYGVVWKPNDKIRSRIAYSETLARPDFREMSPVGFTDDETGYTVVGNAFLKGTVIKNIDHRWEYYFTTDEYASIGVFYKKFQDPIEAIFKGGANRIQTFANAKSATNVGIELEGRMGLRHMARSLRRWTVLSNVSFIDSEIELGTQDVQTSATRPLQGQSPYVLNMQLQYDHPTFGFSSTLLYNIIGKRITEVGVNDSPDIFEQPAGQLDFVATQILKKNWTVSLRARNLLNPEVESTQSEEIVRSYKRGRVFGLVLGAVF